MYQINPIGNSKVKLREDFNSPQVYLDHWALNIISQDDEQRKKFIKIFNECGGTLRISIANIVELAKQGDKKQIESILNMIERIDDCGLINVDPEAVIKKENFIIKNPKAIEVVQNPSAELDIVSLFLIVKNYPKSWHISDIIRLNIENFPLKNLAVKNDEFVRKMQNKLKELRSSNEQLDAANSRYRKIKGQGPLYQACTRELFQLALDFIVRNKGMKMSRPSEWNDLYHLVVPVAYCDIVTVDRKWLEFIKQTGFKYPKVAKTFDQRSISLFFKEIEEWKNKKLS